MPLPYHEKKLFVEPGIPYSFRTYTIQTDGPDTIVQPHYHLFIELIYCQEGSLELLLDGVKHRLLPGDLALVNSMTMHALRSLSEDSSTHIALLFRPDLLYSTSHTPFEMQYIAPFTASTSARPFIFRANELTDSPVPNLLRSIVTEEYEKKYAFELAIRNHIGSIFLWLLRHPLADQAATHTPPLTPETIQRLQLIFDYVEEHYADELSVEDMATLCNVTYSYFSRFFKKHTQHNFKEYLNLVRIHKSETLLVSTNLSVTEIGASVGFAATSYFIEQFKTYKHMTPKKYRSFWLEQQQHQL